MQRMDALRDRLNQLPPGTTAAEALALYRDWLDASDNAPPSDVPYVLSMLCPEDITDALVEAREAWARARGREVPPFSGPPVC